MFLFTTPDRPDSAGRPDAVQTALRDASRSTGVGFDYLLATAKRESSLDPQARAATSSASGLFQFIESTWLETLKEAGPRHGYGDLAEHIEPAGNGRFRVADAQLREEILSLRHDPKAAALMAGELARSNADRLEAAIGRRPDAGELYVAHFLGARGAAELIRLVETAPQTPADQHFSAAAQANRPIFYTGDGHARSAREVYANLISRHQAAGAAGQERTDKAAPGPVGGADQAGLIFHGLFSAPQSGGLGPMARGVGAFWSSLFTSRDEDSGAGEANDAGKTPARQAETPAVAATSAYAPAREPVDPLAEVVAPPVEAGRGEAERPWRWVDPSLPVS